VSDIAINISATQGECGAWHYGVQAITLEGAVVGHGAGYFLPGGHPDQVRDSADAVSADVLAKVEAALAFEEGDYNLFVLDHFQVIESARGQGVSFEMMQALVSMPLPMHTLAVLAPGPFQSDENPHAKPKLQKHWSNFGFSDLECPLAGASGLNAYGHDLDNYWPDASFMGAAAA